MLFTCQAQQANIRRDRGVRGLEFGMIVYFVTMFGDAHENDGRRVQSAVHP